MPTSVGVIPNMNGSGGAGNAYPSVDNYSLLPNPDDHLGEIYIVLNATPVVGGDDYQAGLYEARPGTWVFLGTLTALEVKEKYESNPNTNAYTDAEKAKLAALRTAFTHTQAVAAATWSITHNLGYPPAVRIVDAGGVEFHGRVEHPTANTTIIRFSTPQTGIATLS